MDVKQYIESGVLEAYVLGGLSDREQREVQCMTAIYEELKQHLIEVEEKVEKVMFKHAVTPPDSLKSKVLSAIKHTAQDDVNTESSAETKVISLDSKKAGAGWKVLAAASVVGLIAFSVLWYQQQQRVSGVTDQLADAKVAQQELERQLEALQTSSDEQRELYDLLIAQETKTIELGGTDNNPEASVRVYWNNSKSKVALKINNLPAPETGKQYQLWAIVDGVPTDMGVFDYDQVAANPALMDFSEQQPQAFAITLETEGGNPTPNLDALMVIGNVG